MVERGTEDRDNGREIEETEGTERDQRKEEEGKSVRKIEEIGRSLEILLLKGSS